VERRGEGLWLIATEWASAVLYNGLGRYEDALSAAEQAAEDPHELGLSTWVPTEIIEAAVRSGDPERAAGPLRRLQEISRAAGTDWALGVEARSRALVLWRGTARMSWPAKNTSSTVGWSWTVTTWPARCRPAETCW
jgi:hypothetical protein